MSRVSCSLSLVLFPLTTSLPYHRSDGKFPLHVMSLAALKLFPQSPIILRVLTFLSPRVQKCTQLSAKESGRATSCSRFENPSPPDFRRAAV